MYNVGDILCYWSGGYSEVKILGEPYSLGPYTLCKAIHIKGEWEGHILHGFNITRNCFLISRGEHLFKKNLKPFYFV